MGALLNNAWVDHYLDALLSSGLSTEAAMRASEAPSRPEVDAEANIAAKYYLQQIMALDEESIQQAYLKARRGGVSEVLQLGVNLGRDRVPKLYCVLISLHGLVRGDRMELGRDPDTGGQVKYVVELAKALSRHPAVHRVDLLTRLIRDPGVDASYGAEEEELAPRRGAHGGAFLVRLPCGPVDKYIRKEALWPYVREFADHALGHVTGMLTSLAAAGEGCELYQIHGHYADAGEAAALMAATLGTDMVLTGHSLGRNKLDHLLKSRTTTRREIEETYAMSRRIEGEERALDAACLVFTSTRQEVSDQWGLYDGYDATLERILRARPRRGRHFPKMAVVPPGLDFSNLKVPAPADPWQLLDAAQHAGDRGAAGGGGGGGGSGTGSGAPSPSPGSARSRRTSAAGEALDLAPVSPKPPGGSATGLPPLSPRRAAGAGASPFHRTPDVGNGASGGAAGSTPLSLSAGGGASLFAPAASPRAPPTPGLHALGGASVTLATGAGVGGGPIAGTMAGGYEDPPIWQEIFRFLRNPRKPVILAMSRPDHKKNIATLVRAYGECRPLREIANLVLVMGNRKVIDGMAPGSAKVLETVLKLVDAYDLYGSVAYPKRHSQDDISDIYLLPHHTRGVFVNVALQEPFGLTLIEAAAHRVPIVATTHGGPVDIIATLGNGLLVDPTDRAAVGDALLKLLTDGALWDQCAAAGRDNIVAYSWPSHCIKCLRAIEHEQLRASARRKTALRSTYSMDLGEPACQPPPAAAAGGGGGDGGSGEAGATDASVGGPDAAAEAAAGLAAPGAAEAGRAAADAVQALSVTLTSEPTFGGALPPLTLAPTRSASNDGASAPAATPRAEGAPPRRQSNGGVPAASPRSGGSLDARSFSALLQSSQVPLGTDGGPPPLAPPVSSKGRYMVLALDAADAAARLGSLFGGGKGGARALARLAAAAGGAPVGLGAASAAGLDDTLALLGAAGVAPSSLDFLITNCGAQIWYPAKGEAVSAAGAAAAAAAQIAADEAYEAFIDHAWDKVSVRRVLAQLLAQRGLLANLTQGARGTGGGGGAAAGAAAGVRISADTGTGPHHLLLTIRRTDDAAAPAAAGAPLPAARPALSGAELSTLVARLKKRLRSSGLRTQVVAAVEADGSARLHITPLRVSRALALRYLAHRHRVEMKSLVVVSCARELQAPAPPPPAAAAGISAAAAAVAATAPAMFAASDAEDLLAGAMGALVVPPLGAPALPAGGGAGAAASPGGFMVDLGLFMHDDRLQLLPGGGSGGGK